jgi:tRNA dimethylallyltransferase
MTRELLAIVGLTCSGKGKLALDVADALGGPEAVGIVVCDSAKVYRGADVGTAKPPVEARRGYEFLMVDVVDPGVPYSAGRYMREGREACRGLWERGKLALVVGGTGLYFRALRDGIAEAPPADEEVRAKLAARSDAGEDLHALLARMDAAYAEKISPRDAKRIVRALEVYELTGLPLSEIHGRGAEPLAVGRIAAFALDAGRPWLAGRVEERTDRMMAAGLVDETKRLLELAGGPTAPPLNAIGYRQMVRFLSGGLDEGTARAEIVTETLRLAKRQRTWFKGERDIIHLVAEDGPETLAAAIIDAWRAS